MTDDKHTKRAARELAAREGISYTAARRRLVDDRQEPPPVAYRTVGAPCPEGCDGSMHPGSVCWLWRPADLKGSVSWSVRRSAELSGGRAEQVAQRGEDVDPKTQSGRWARSHSCEDRWLLALAYAMLADQRPELRPDRAALRAAVEADDLAAVDAAVEPLDRAAARLLTKVPAQWWGEVKPRLDAYADDVKADTWEPRTWREIDEWHVVGRLVERGGRRGSVRNHNGYMDPPGVLWLAPKGWIDRILVEQLGGYAPGARVRLADGRPAVVYAVEWGEGGPPLAYRVRELVPGTHGNVGRLVPSLTSDELHAAANCRPLDDRA
ncbi:hypothetical protein ACWEBX_03185 [Streptomyces sp. NPDC005070]